jgi:hypothetical protein
MGTLLLKDQDIHPTDEVIEKAVRESYPAYAVFLKTISGPEYGLMPEWNYYKDGKAWLCKVTFKKKTVFWLSVWDGFFKTTFYFTEKHLQGIADLSVDEKIKEDFNSMKPIGKLLPLTLEVTTEKQIPDILKLIEFKKSLK